MQIMRSRDCTGVICNLEIGTQSQDSENAQCNLEIAQILRLCGTYTHTYIYSRQLLASVGLTHACPNYTGTIAS